MKTDNQIISDARGECRHEFEQIAITQNTRFRECECRKCHHRITLKGNEMTPDSPDYLTLSTWTPELYQFIEDEGLHRRFTQFVIGIPHYVKKGDYDIDEAWGLAKATPAQKAQALASAIKERDQ